MPVAGVVVTGCRDDHRHKSFSTHVDVGSIVGGITGDIQVSAPRVFVLNHVTRVVLELVVGLVVGRLTDDPLSRSLARIVPLLHVRA